MPDQNAPDQARLQPSPEAGCSPWTCLHCGQRFKYEEDAIVHSNHCKRSPANREEAFRCTEKKLVSIRDALIALHITGDSLFSRIREDLGRGLVREARTKLNFVDIIVNSNEEVIK
jgi:hypothetical protein